MKAMYEKTDISKWIEYQTTDLYNNSNSNSFIEEYYYSLWHKENKVSFSPLITILNITNSCNLRCMHCSKKEFFNEKFSMKYSDVIKIIDKLYEAKAYKIVLTGGEPLLHPKIIDIITYIKNKGISLKILTNLNVSLDLIEHISQVLNFEEDEIQISIDDVYDNYQKIRKGGNFQLIEQNIDMLAAYNIKTTVNMVITKQNYKSMLSVLKYCEKKQIKGIRFSRYFNYKGDEDNLSDEKLFMYFDEVLDYHRNNSASISILSDPISMVYPYFAYLKEKDTNFNYETSPYLCPAAIISMELDINGNAYPCSYFVDRGICCGNIFDSSVEEIWNSSKMIWFRTFKTNNRKCEKCIEFKNCMGGCKAGAFCTAGNLNHSDPTCFIIQGGYPNETE